MAAAKTLSDSRPQDWPQTVFDILTELDVRQVAIVPDAGHSRLIRLCEDDARKRVVTLTTEEEGVALLAGAWLGGLLPLLLTVRGQNERDRAADFVLRRFSALGMLAIAIILAGGMVNSWAHWSSFEALIASAWGKVLIAKVLGFAVLVALAAINRFVLMQRFVRDAPSRARLTRNIVAEQAGGLAILAAAAVLGILPPPA